MDPPRTLLPTLQDAQKPSTQAPTVINFRGQDKWNYTAASDLLFSYKLDEGGWTAFSNVTAHVFQNLSAGSHLLELLAMDRNGNKSTAPSQLQFSVITPWFRDPRLISVSLLALVAIFILAGVAVNRHFQLKRSYAQVEQIVAQRTRELERANQELLHSQKMRAIGTMAAGIAHDFNNILSIIKGSAQIIDGNIEDKEKIRTRVSRIQMVVEQGTGIVKALLGLGRGNEQDLAYCDLCAMLSEIRKLVSDRFPESVRFEIQCDPSLPRVQCSAEVLQQMLLNFIVNAADAMGNNGLVTLSAELIRELPTDLALEPAKAARWAAVSVRDEGGGIRKEILPRIFEPFFTTKAFSSRRGTGLGLSMAYELAKGLGYGLAVRTKVGQGTAFSILLPCPGMMTDDKGAKGQAMNPAAGTKRKVAL
jgi:signal transduction histidine kinase